MELAAIVGFPIAFAALLATIFIEGSDPSSLLLPGPLVLVFGATIGVAVAGSTVRDAVSAFKMVPAVFTARPPDLKATVDKLVELADLVRHSGILALDGAATDTDDEFLKSALQGVADGADSEDLAEHLQDTSEAHAKSARRSANFFNVMGGYAPTVGIIGTVVALTHVLANLSTPNKLGPMIASAFVATLWGLLSANFIWLPLGNRLTRLGELQTERQELVIVGVLAIQEGISARALAERLNVLVPHTGKDVGDARRTRDANRGGTAGGKPAKGRPARRADTAPHREKEAVDA